MKLNNSRGALPGIKWSCSCSLADSLDTPYGWLWNSKESGPVDE
jgi:hypothetical protein